MAGPARRNGIPSRRRVEDEDGEGQDIDDSLSEGSISHDDDADSILSDGTHHTATESPVLSKVHSSNGHIRTLDKAVGEATAGVAAMKTGSEGNDTVSNGATETGPDASTAATVDVAGTKKNAVQQPAVVRSTAAMNQPVETPLERKRREHEEYKKQRDENPSFVPNRGAFFMHDHRHAGPAANGFRPFGRDNRGRGGRGGIGGPFAPRNFLPHIAEPSDSPWTHDMHEATLEDNRSQRPQSRQGYNTAASLRQPLPQAPTGPAPNRAMSSTKLLGKVQLRVSLAGMEAPTLTPSISVHQYTLLPDHRPPLRRDKPVRISLPEAAPRYIFPAVERSFIFIPRAMRPNHQGFGSRSNRGRQGLGSVGGYSRRTSIYGGASVYGGSVYSPSVAMSRRSSLVHEVSRDIISNMGSSMSRPPMAVDAGKPVVRLPPPMTQTQSAQYPVDMQRYAESAAPQYAQPQPYHMPQKPTFRENRLIHVPMQHPRPQKAVSVDVIESPAALQYHAPQTNQQPFGHQLPPQMNGHGYGEYAMNAHSRQTSHQGSVGTPLSQIPERAVYAHPFQPTPYQQQQQQQQQMQEYYPQAFQMPYYYPQQYPATMASPAPAFAAQIPQQAYYPGQVPVTAAAEPPAQGVVMQEVNGETFYYDARQITPAVASFPYQQSPQVYTQAQQYPMQQQLGVVQGQDMMGSSPDGYYYPQAAPGGVYYPQ